MTLKILRKLQFYTELMNDFHLREVRQDYSSSSAQRAQWYLFGRALFQVWRRSVVRILKGKVKRNKKLAMMQTWKWPTWKKNRKANQASLKSRRYGITAISEQKTCWWSKRPSHSRSNWSRNSSVTMLDYKYAKWKNSKTSLTPIKIPRHRFKNSEIWQTKFSSNNSTQLLNKVSIFSQQYRRPFSLRVHHQVLQASERIDRTLLRKGFLGWLYRW